MKKIILILTLLFLAPLSYGANVITAIGPSPAGTAGAGAYKAGDQFAITYSATFLLTNGYQTQIDIIYDNTVLQLVDPSVVTSSGVFLPSTPTITGAIYQYNTPTYTMAEDFSGATTFTLNFRVIGATCGIPSQAIQVKLSTFHPTPTIGLSDIQTATTVININNSNAMPTVDMQLISGLPCYGSALYMIKSIGVSPASPFEGFYMNLPTVKT